jgi:hypothetical protein
MIEKHYGRYFPQTGDGALVEAALGGWRNVKPKVKPSDLAEPALSEALLDSVGKAGTSERATRRSRTGDLLITNLARWVASDCWPSALSVAEARGVRVFSPPLLRWGRGVRSPSAELAHRRHTESRAGVEAAALGEHDGDGAIDGGRRGRNGDSLPFHTRAASGATPAEARTVIPGVHSRAVGLIESPACN